MAAPKVPKTKPQDTAVYGDLEVSNSLQSTLLILARWRRLKGIEEHAHRMRDFNNGLLEWVEDIQTEGGEKVIDDASMALMLILAAARLILKLTPVASKNPVMQAFLETGPPKETL